MARQFLIDSKFLSAVGVIEVPAMAMIEEGVEFIFPAVISILEKHLARGGLAFFFFFEEFEMWH